MREYSDEELMAYADGELPEAQAAELRETIAREPALARRVDAYRQSRELLRGVFAPRAQEPVPPRLLALLQTADLPAPAPRWRARRWSVPLALAATLALAIGLSLRNTGQQGGDPMSVALETMASGEPLKSGAQEILPLATLRDAQGRWCREYQTSGPSGSAHGLACREPSSPHWVAQDTAAATAGASPPDGQYHTASGNQAAPGAALTGAHQLTVAEEREAIRQHWH